MLLSFLLWPPLVVAAAPQAPGGGGRVVLQADAAWLAPGERIAPAFVVVENGKILAVGSQEPRGGGERVQLKGTLAPVMVDAWSRLVGADALADGHPLPYMDVTQGLPADLAGSDPVLSARVAAARQAGIGAVWLSSGANLLQRGLATAAVFSRHDLPVAAGEQALEIALGSVRLGENPQGLVEIERLAEALEAAMASRDAEAEYQEKLEQYQKDLAEYEKKFEEYLKKKKESEAGGQGQQGGEKQEEVKEQQEEQKSPPGRRRPGAPPELQDQSQSQQGAGGAPPAKKDEAPKRPQRPKAPERDPARALLLRALDRELPLRVEANRASEIRRLLELKEKYDFDLIIAGGEQADWVAAELAAAQVPVVLAAVPPHHDPAAVPRHFAARFQALQAAGVTVALSSGGSDAAQALLGMRAGEAVAAGSGVDQVWAALTTVPAELLGLSASHGRLRSGAAAQFVLFEGSSPFDASAPFRSLSY